MPEPGRSRDQRRERERERNPVRRQSGEVGDDRAARRGDRDRDRQRKIDDQRADRQKRPLLTERAPRCLRRAAALRERAHELPIVQRDADDDPDHDPDRRQQQAEMPVQRAQSGLDLLRDRGDGVGHGGEREGEEQQRFRPPADRACRVRRCAGRATKPPQGIDEEIAAETSRHTCEHPSRSAPRGDGKESRMVLSPEPACARAARLGGARVSPRGCARPPRVARSILPPDGRSVRGR